MSSAQEQLWVQGQLRKDVERWVSVLSGERPDDAPARTNFDLYLFAQVGFLLADVEQELIGIAEWEQAIRDIERCINNNPSVRAFEERLRRAGQAPLASRTFLDLAKRQVRRKANPRKANQSIPIRNGSPTSTKVAPLPRSCWLTTRPKTGGSATCAQMSLANVSQRIGYVTAALAAWNSSSDAPKRAGSGGMLSNRSATCWEVRTISPTHSPDGTFRLTRGTAGPLPRSPHLPIAPPRSAT